MRFDLKSFSRLAALAVPVAIGLIGARLLVPFLPDFARLVEQMGVWAPVAFVVAYVVVVICMMPAFLLIMVGGAVFGLAKGTLLSMVGALVGGTLAFLIARHFARDLVVRRIAGHPALASIDRVVGEDGMKIVFLLRLSAAVPFVLSNYALGVTRVPLPHFMLGTIGLIPTVLTYAAYGSASSTGVDGKPTMSPVVVGLGIAATVLLGILLTRIAQKALRDAHDATATAAAHATEDAAAAPSPETSRVA
jgi:uncharacterized membrane protein YdjX (TVP38/TMEM64 family)